MFRHYIFLSLVAIVLSVVFADSSEQKESWYDDYYLGELDDKELFTNLQKSTISDSNDYIGMLGENKEDDDLSSNINENNETKIFEDDLKKYLIEDKNDEKDDDNFDDYQFEDNRFDVDNSYDDNQTNEKNTEQSSELSNNVSNTNKTTDKDILEETKSILNENAVNDFVYDKIFGTNTGDDTDNSQIFEETSKILDESYGMTEDKVEREGAEEFNSVSESEEELKKMMTATEEGEKSVEKDDTVHKSIRDYMHDLEEINENDYRDSNENQKMDGDYEEIYDSELEKIFENNSKSEEEKDDFSEEIFSEKTSSTEAKTYKPVPYINDAIVANDIDRSLSKGSSDSVDDMKESSVTETLKLSEATEPMSPTTAEETTLRPETNLMSSAEEDAAIKKFIELNPSILDVKASDIINATNIWLTVSSSVEVTSPDYPSPYPTNNTVDWMFQGAGQGIELNITEFSINGYLEDYLLVKPGGVDTSGSSGLIFTYSLRNERRYRFLDVDRMFVRFVARPGNQLFRGFKFSARMVVPLPNALPEPEEDIPSPVDPATITVNLGGISPQNFGQVEERFRRIIADMATIYINTNSIDAGLNTTLEGTQITRRAFCYHKWPKFELCTEVQFGVQLVYDESKKENMTEEARSRLNEQDLTDMWISYSQRDPFAARLRALGIAEYQIPNDKSVLALWLVVAAGVVISAALLALALWRYSCFEDYTRMPVYGDTDSLAEKRKLDLYPTPHQTLPPLFETDYKWPEDLHGNKVDIGFTNNSFLSEDFFEPRAERLNPLDRNYSFSPREAYDV